MAVGQSRFGIPFWLEGEFTTHVRTYFSGDWDFHWGCDLGFDPWPHRKKLDQIETAGFSSFFFGLPPKPLVDNWRWLQNMVTQNGTLGNGTKTSTCSLPWMFEPHPKWEQKGWFWEGQKTQEFGRVHVFSQEPHLRGNLQDPLGGLGEVSPLKQPSIALRKHTTAIRHALSVSQECDASSGRLLLLWGVLRLTTTIAGCWAQPRHISVAETCVPAC